MCEQKKLKKFFVQTIHNCPVTIREGGNNMQTQTNAEAVKDERFDEELADTLTAISCIQKTGSENQALSTKKIRKEVPKWANE